MLKTITAGVIGAGNRGNDHGDFTLFKEGQLKVTAVAEPSQDRREQFADKFKIQQDHVFSSWEDFFAGPKLCDAVIITTQDNNHYEPVMAALEKGYHVLVEKPMSPSVMECKAMVDKANEKGKMLLLAYVLRYTPFFQKIKELISVGKIGEVRHISIDMEVGYWHQAHSFVRGNWRKSTDSSPMILAKACHDFDILHYLLESPCLSISSFGDLTHFRMENAPEGSADRCMDCSGEESCPYSATKIYLTDNTGWPVNTISTDLSFEGRRKALETGPYGRCVYHCDNDVVDHQIVNLQFGNKATAVITMSGFTNKLERTVRVLGTHGEIAGTFSDNQLTLQQFGKSKQAINIKPSSFGRHGGGDYGIMTEFSRRLADQNPARYNTYETIYSHIYAHAAEEARVTNKVINPEIYIDSQNNIKLHS
ncbi:Gfo/Idh/MocA family oxidoreductase [Evansella sp. LMS18]|uniref:Gfo/Idh/MocA family protein n=1 Tax=Evansella sp. LMS18 TaxID=2924033 RepID=UPI0020D17AE1|nr:Gfo/Idh/MocA family oxidoreductase [Evansella sp. LMS18]UTR12678.1 Gfo/Idh/MocA family oxidoreductase [Evansella sp. LMS18]